VFAERGSAVHAQILVAVRRVKVSACVVWGVGAEVLAL
jgi:hypothetical protein